MICEKCGVDSEAIKDSWCMYQQQPDGEVINKLFHPDHIPNGWYDSPGAAMEANKRAANKPPKATSEGLRV